MSKRKGFDIDFPEGEDPVPAGTPAADAPPARRGPMASAITENAEALRARQEAEAAIRAENDRLAHELVRLKGQGLIVDLIDIGAIATTKLARDRSATRDPELDELKASIRAIGLSNPIRVEADGDSWQLVQGFRRLSAYRELYEETGDDRFARIPAGINSQGETIEGLYRRMVDENLVRRDISFAEMAALALSYAQDSATEAEDVEQAVAVLYASAGRQKRVYIRHFATVLEAIGSRLKYPEAIPRALGLDLEKRISGEEGAAARIRAALGAGLASSAEAELGILRAQAVAAPPKPPKAQGRGGAPDAAKTSFRCTVPAGTVRCAARNGRVELTCDRDFSIEDQQRLQAAVAAFFAELDGAGGQ
ncbi:ParB N-terminal domain-containing protein [Roseovarius nanhaiticus]|uniref:ParB N-terminal domain-containing protein n=1 Tax=Roseovarius nanhaiticus TaxID=573024 RepID=UPI0024924784|nr:ParB N-terminal domain-containing protein [Roseovarius nanhaiticus]